LKDFQGSGEAFSSPRRRPSCTNHEIYLITFCLSHTRGPDPDTKTQLNPDRKNGNEEKGKTIKTYKLLPYKKTSKGNGVNAPNWEKMKVGNLQGKGGCRGRASGEQVQM